MPLPTIRSACAAAAAGLILAGCGTASREAAFRSGYLAARPRVQAIIAQVRSTAATAAGRLDVLLAGQFTKLGSRSASEAYAVAALAPPVRYNTRVRDLGSALLRTAEDLDHLATATAQQNTRAVATVIRALRSDARTVRLTEVAVADALGLHSA
jgi:hypothetical protein